VLRLYLGLVVALALCLAAAAIIAANLADKASAASGELPLGWSVSCDPLLSRKVDPIVYPGMANVGHLHDPFGQRLDPNMTYEKLRDDPSNCTFKNGTQVDDRSAYWIPALYSKAGMKVDVRVSNGYYRVKPGMDPNDIKPFPKGLKIIAGHPDATGPQMQPDGYKPGKPIVEWKCFAPGNFSNFGNLPTDCGQDQHVAVSITFPDCAKRDVSDSSDHRSHMAYSRFMRCPASHPTHVMQLNLFIVYDLHNGKDAYLSSNHQDPPKAYGMHADFFDGWGRTQIRNLIRNCVYSGNGCSSAGITGR
jgi:Domain of unknown function (DUF1996)